MSRYDSWRWMDFVAAISRVSNCVGEVRLPESRWIDGVVFHPVQQMIVSACNSVPFER